MLAGIDAALDAGLDPVKVNAVVIRGVNDDEVVDLAALRARARASACGSSSSCRSTPQGEWSRGPGRARRTRSSSGSTRCSRSSAVPARDAHVEPAARFRYRDGIGDVGVIASVTEPFCEQLRPRAHHRRGQVPHLPVRARGVRPAGRCCGGGGLDDRLDDRLAAAIAGAVGTKWAGHRIGQVDFVRPDRSMSQIGG